MVMNSVAFPKATFLKSVSLVTSEAVEESIRISVKPGDFPVALINLNRVKALSENDPGLSVKDKRLLVDPVSANTVV
jgi:Fe-S cluster assembly iron-binding protein IscA